MSLDKIRELSIKDIISGYVDLKKKGVNYTGLCPFHDEKTPSFSVSEAKNIFKCFGCGIGGDGIKFVMEKDKLDFIQAAAKIAQEHGIEFKPKELTDEEKKEEQLLQEIVLFHQVVAQWFKEQLQITPEAKQYVDGRISQKNQDDFEVGFAPPGWNKLFEAMRKKGYKEEFLLKTNLFTQKDNGKVFDFFQNRIIFPITNNTGQVIAFSGRVMDDTKPKYINSPEARWYQKSKILYGLRFALKEIVLKDYINITEGYTDVMTMHDAKHTNTAALGGTALTEEHVNIIKRYTHNVNLVMDGDGPGNISAYKASKLLIGRGFKVTVTTTIPEDSDPDDYFRQPDAEFDRKPFLLEFAGKYFADAGADPLERADHIREVASFIALLPKVDQNAMIDHLAKAYKKEGITKHSLRQAVNGETAESDTDKREFELDEKSLPKYVDKTDYRKYGFYISQGLNGDMFAKNQYIFDSTHRVSNFVMHPLYHINSETETKKLFQVINKYSDSSVIEMDMEAMNSLPKFKRIVESAGNNLFEGSEKHLTHLKRKWYDDTKYCKRIANLGWQKDGFFAWANGITTMDEDFIPVDENGIIAYKDNNYFIPVYSSIYKNKAGVFESERKFVYLKNEIGLHEWAKMFLSVYGEQSMLSVAFFLTSLFSDFIFSRLNNLPLLNFYGQKGTGKNEQAMSLMAFFGKMQNALQIHNTTHAGLASHMEEFVNACFWIDEYKNNLPIHLIEGIKGIYNRHGRTRKSMKEGQGKEATNVNSMGIVTGQEMLTIDVALFSRVIFLPYYKTEFSETEKEKLQQLHAVQEKGLSHITAKIIKHRKLVESNYLYAFNEVNKELGESINLNQVDTRISRNFTTVLATFKCLEKVLDLPFSYKDMLKIAGENILRHNEFMQSSNELAQFWSIIESGIEKFEIVEDKNYKIKVCDYLKVISGKDFTEKSFKPPKEVFLLKWSGIFQYYAETARRSNQLPLPETTLKYYLETSAPFIGKVKSVRFDNDTNQARAFDYKLLEMNFSRKKSIDDEDDADDTEAPPDKPGSDADKNKNNKGEDPKLNFKKDAPF